MIPLNPEMPPIAPRCHHIARKEVCNDVEEIEQDNEGEDEMERCLQAMANGE